mmetsp:Transcript_3249/g.3449  ORF Transcript_3249/g.3449 Transcript_3249/m.3449 type:complete len:343 (-) Transcript_3249:393-1421(-)|eukprot:CAMPEP_0170785316 /NCGR_PEP_ID=MMETSP0733-20121128/16827_1 /TAXON_ID=186038 /ORGANISM="Fragilariopsis kerguelensis, Strain L26-C5" /LENGTH=342 /DNA_ID=CAMNT_0011130733 /DNA_START=64 /DNA_END=1092 /DNA_ORIENTATION=-
MIATTMMSSNGETDATTGLLDSDTVMQSYLDILKDGSSSKMNISTVRSLALKAISHPQIFCGFDEFKICCSQLISPQEQSNVPNASRSLFNTLDLFSFGTLKDYQKQGESTGEPNEYYLPLNEPALAKLRQLAVLTCVQKACFDGKTRISYDDVSEALGVTTDPMQDGKSSSNTNTITAIRDVEDVLIQCLYANVLKGKLCQKTSSFGWQGENLPVVSSRDIPPTLIPNLLSELQGLSQRLEENGIEVTQAQEQVTKGLVDAAMHWKKVRKQKNTTQDESFSKVVGDVATSTARGGFFGEHSEENWHESSGGSFGINNPRKSSKRSRGGMSGNFHIDAGTRI